MAKQREKKRRGAPPKGEQQQLIRKDFRLRFDQIARLAQEENASEIVREALDLFYQKEAADNQCWFSPHGVPERKKK